MNDVIGRGRLVLMDIYSLRIFENVIKMSLYSSQLFHHHHHYIILRHWNHLKYISSPVLLCLMSQCTSNVLIFVTKCFFHFLPTGHYQGHVHTAQHMSMTIFSISLMHFKFHITQHEEVNLKVNPKDVHFIWRTCEGFRWQEAIY